MYNLLFHSGEITEPFRKEVTQVFKQVRLKHDRTFHPLTWFIEVLLKKKKRIGSFIQRDLYM